VKTTEKETTTTNDKHTELQSTQITKPQQQQQQQQQSQSQPQTHPSSQSQNEQKTTLPLSKKNIEVVERDEDSSSVEGDTYDQFL
jgi:hypothetical protein